MGIGYSTNAQVNKHTFGYRLKTHDGIGFGNFTYQLGLTPKSRLDFGASLSGGFSGNNVNLKGMCSLYYHRVINSKGGLNFFYGAGLGHSMFRSNFSGNQIFTQRFDIGAQIGLEYDFSTHNFPLILALDYNPMLRFVKNGAYIDKTNFGFSIRYVIK